MTKKHVIEQEKAREYLTGADGIQITPTDTLHMFQRHVSRSGLRRIYDVYVVRGSDLIRITNSVATLCGYRYDPRRQGIAVDGYGFSAACDIAHALSRVLFPQVSFQSGTMPYHDHL